MEKGTIVGIHDLNISIYPLLSPLQVRGSSKLDPCYTSPDEAGNRLKSQVVGPGSKLEAFLGKGEVSQAAQLALSVLKAANAKPDCDKEISILVKIVVSFKDANAFVCYNLRFKV